MSVTLPNPPLSSGQGNDRAKEARANGAVDADSYAALDNLFNILNYTKFNRLLEFRVAAAAMICNAAGVLAGVGGGKMNSAGLEKTKYRISEPSSAPPSTDLPTTIEALASQSRAVNVPTEYGDSELVSVSRSSLYNPTPKFADYKIYSEKHGPPLAPFGDQSRIITNYVVEMDPSESGGLHATCGWDGIYSVDESGGNKQEFLEQLFKGRPGKGGKGGIPARDIRGATDYESNQIRRQVEAWLGRIAYGRNNV